MRSRQLFTAPGFGRRYCIFAACLVIGWLVLAADLGPALLIAGHAADVPIVSGVLSGRDRVAVDVYLADWAALVPKFTFIQITTLLILFPALVVIRRSMIGPRTQAVPEGGQRPDRTALAATSIVALGAWFGLVAGAGESYYIAAKSMVLGEVVPGFRHASPDSLWMAPVVNVVLFSAVAAGIWGLGRVMPRMRTPGVTVLVLSFLTFVVWILLPGRVATWATLILAAALAARTAALVGGRPSGFARIPLRSWPWLTGAWVGIAAAVWLYPRLSEGLELSGLPEPPARAANVLIIVLDAQRAANTSLYASQRNTTPNLARRALTGVVFDRAMATSSWTLPSISSMLTGRLNHQLGTDLFTPLAKEHPTLAEVLRSHGYVTGGFVANIYFGGNFYGLNRGFIRWKDQPRSLGMALDSPVLGRKLISRLHGRLFPGHRLVEKRADEVSASFLHWVDRVGDRPFLALLNYFDAHAPYMAPDSFMLAYSSRKPLTTLRKGLEPSGYTSEELAELEEAYDASIAYLDYELDRLLDALDERGVLERTLIVVTSDHGESFGEHGFLQHGNSLYLEEIHVPLVIWPPGGVPGGRRVDRVVSLRSIPSTILELLGLERGGISGPSLADYVRPASGQLRTGRDVVRPLDGDGASWEGAVSELGGWRSLVTDRYHYLRRADGVEELYDLVTDPGERTDLSAEVGASKLAEFHRALERASDTPATVITAR